VARAIDFVSTLPKKAKKTAARKPSAKKKAKAMKGKK